MAISRKNSELQRLGALLVILCLAAPSSVYGLRPGQPAESAGLEELERSLGGEGATPWLTRRGFLRGAFYALFGTYLVGAFESLWKPAVRQDRIHQGGQGPGQAPPQGRDPAAEARLNGRIRAIVNEGLISNNTRFLNRQRISDRPRVRVANIPEARLAEYRCLRGRAFEGFDFNGLFQSYAVDERNPNWAQTRFLATGGRVWVYDSALGILDDIAADRMGEARRAIRALVEIGRDEEALGFTGGWHFSYNTIEDSWIDPRAPMGNTLWAMKAIYAYVEKALRSDDRDVREEALRHLEWVNGLLRRLVFEMQVMKEGDPRYGLIQAMKYNTLLDTRNPRTGRNYTLDEAGYRVYEGNPNQTLVDVIFEHNADLVDVYRMAANVMDQARLEGREAFIRELARRHEVLLNAIWEKAWVDDHFVTAMRGDGTLNRSVAVDNNTWVAQVFLPYEEDRAWQAIEYVWNNFRTKDRDGRVVTRVSGLVLDGNFSDAARRRLAQRPFTGIFFFQQGFEDPYVDVPRDQRPKLEQMVQAEAAFGYIHYLVEFARVTQDTARRDEALRRAQAIYDSVVLLSQIYEGDGLPYSTVFVHLFTTLRGMASSATALTVSRLMQDRSRVGFIGVDPHSSFLFQRRRPGERPAPREQPERREGNREQGVLPPRWRGNPAVGLGLLSERYAPVNVGRGSAAFAAAQEPLPAGVLTTIFDRVGDLLASAGLEEITPGEGKPAHPEELVRSRVASDVVRASKLHLEIVPFLTRFLEGGLDFDQARQGLVGLSSQYQPTVDPDLARAVLFLAWVSARFDLNIQQGMVLVGAATDRTRAMMVLIDLANAPGRPLGDDAAIRAIADEARRLSGLAGIVLADPMAEGFRLVVTQVQDRIAAGDWDGVTRTLIQSNSPLYRMGVFAFLAAPGETQLRPAQLTELGRRVILSMDPQAGTGTVQLVDANSFGASVRGTVIGRFTEPVSDDVREAAFVGGDDSAVAVANFAAVGSFILAEALRRTFPPDDTSETAGYFRRAADFLSGRAWYFARESDRYGTSLPRLWMQGELELYLSRGREEQQAIDELVAIAQTGRFSSIVFLDAGLNPVAQRDLPMEESEAKTFISGNVRQAISLSNLSPQMVFIMPRSQGGQPFIWVAPGRKTPGVTAQAGLEGLFQLTADPEIEPNLGRFGSLFGNRFSGIIRPDGRSVVEIGSRSRIFLPEADFIISRRDQPNLLSGRSWQFVSEESEPIVLVSEALIPLDDMGLLINAVAGALLISPQEAARRVRFVPADPSRALQVIDAALQDSVVIHAALDEASYGRAVQIRKEQLTGSTILLLETSNLRRLFGVFELLNLLTDLRHFQRISTYTTFDINGQEALLISA
ncbi:MAG: hypothetical protein NC910_02395 [Candidatus Omnitrophica bacterium]|nr:hypothetical protein [Candidatus Omnitrophota bacterium]